MNYTTISALAAEAYNCFEYVTIGEKSQIALKTSAPGWVVDMVYDAHDGALPDDYVYETVFQLLEAISWIRSYSDLDRAEREIQADSYTSDLLKWVASSDQRQYYVDQAMAEGEINLFGALYRGQLMEKLHIFRRLLSALQLQAEDEWEREQLLDIENEEGEDTCTL